MRKKNDKRKDKPRRRFGQMGVNKLHSIVRTERKDTRNEKVQGDAERIHVHSVIWKAIHSSRLLRRHEREHALEQSLNVICIILFAKREDN